MKLFLASLLTTTLSFIPTTANAYESTSSKVTKTFRFKDDFFLKIDPLSTAIAPGVNTDDLLSALDAYGETFRDKWVLSLMLNTLPQDECEVVVRSFVLIGECSFGALCTVSLCAQLMNRLMHVICSLQPSFITQEMSVPEFSIAQWRYPENYNIEELPAAGQSYIHPDTYVSSAGCAGMMCFTARHSAFDIEYMLTLITTFYRCNVSITTSKLSRSHAKILPMTSQHIVISKRTSTPQLHFQDLHSPTSSTLLAALPATVAKRIVSSPLLRV